MQKKDIVMKEYYKIILIFVMQMMLLTIFVTHNFMKNHVYTPSKTQSLIEVLLGVIIFSFSLASIFIVKKLYKTAKEQHMYKINELKYAHIEEQSRIQRQNKHDLTNHLILLCALAQEEKYSELKEYLSNYISEVNNVQIQVDSGLKEMDILLYSKVEKAQKKNLTIEFNCSAFIQCKKRYVINIISMLGNLIDNAIEASNLSDERKLTILINEDPLDYVFIIKNSFSNKGELNPCQVLEKGISTKGETRGQGFQIVKNLVNKFEGNLDYQITTNLFEVELALPKHNLQN